CSPASLGGIYKSTNGGTTWTAANLGTENLPISDLDVDPNDPNTVLATRGIFLGQFDVLRTIDGGSSWQPVSGLGTTTVVQQVDFDPVVPHRVLGAGITKDTSQGRTYVSLDGGATWVESGVLADGTPGITGIKISPHNPKVAYVTMRIRGVAKTMDG